MSSVVTAVHPRRRRWSVALALPLVALAACGSSSDSDQIRTLLQNSAADPPSSCAHFTQRLLAAHFGGSTATCEKQASAPGAKDTSFKVDGVNVTGTTAVAHGTTKDGRRTFYLVKQGGDWKIDRVAAG